jgi:hypothetical protein
MIVATGGYNVKAFHIRTDCKERYQGFDSKSELEGLAGLGSTSALTSTWLLEQDTHDSLRGFAVPELRDSAFFRTPVLENLVSRKYSRTSCSYQSVCLLLESSRSPRCSNKSEGNTVRSER